MADTFESNVELLCFSSTGEAMQSATQVAAVCGGVVIEIGRIEVTSHWVTFQGVVPRLMAQDRLGRSCGGLTSIIMTKPPKSCALNTTWANVLEPNGVIGYLALNDFGSVVKTTTVEEWDEETGPPDTVLCQLCFERILFSMPNTGHGMTYCEVCGCQVPVERVRAVPGVHRCLKCQDN